MVTKENRNEFKGITRSFFVPAHHPGAGSEYSSRGVQGVIIFPALILMAGWSHSPSSSHPRPEDPRRAFEKKENVRVTRDSRSQPLHRGRSVVPRVIRTGEKKLAKLNVRPYLGGSKGSKGGTTNPHVLLSRPLSIEYRLFAINYSSGGEKDTNKAIMWIQQKRIREVFETAPIT